MKDQIVLILVLLASAWALYKSVKIKSERLLCGVVILLSFQLTKYPYWLPIDISLAICGFFCFFAILYKVVYHKLDKNLIIYAIMFLFFGIIFLFEGLFFSPLGKALIR